ncbi:ABC transporter substrate-binding protein [Streptomyces sp. AJS327]|uniref:peptide ABC transporter substrate-binding protein n=1 Tax=Streptomyces sp. AJS327 TaxID=2545265 RepID=UPI0015DE354E|nr:ABC transporter substrate-binding protein [Streptomyces sp. AJS327]MBA0051390.1 ABC transporter substrate-binding protein [Streptomyces sp. AJS327]
MRGARSAKFAASAIVVVMAATACGGSGDGGSSSGEADPDGVLSVENGEPQNPLQPANVKEQYGSQIIKAVFSQLVKYENGTGKLQMENAESVESKDNKTWTIKLKPGWTFHNGEKVTAKSYVDAWNWGANIDNNQTNSSWFADIKGFEDVHPEKGDPKSKKMSGLKVVDDNTFTVELNSSNPTFSYKLGYDVWSPLPSVFYKDPKAAGKKPIGNGPYKLDKWENKKFIKVSRYDKYKGSDKPKNGGIEFKNYTSLETAYADLRSGNLDIVRQISPKDLPKYHSDLGDRAIDKPYNATQIINFAFYTDQWKDIDPKVKQGLSMAIDRETITKTVLQGSREPSTGFVPAGVRGYQKDACGKYCKYNAKEANKLIKEGGGVPGKKIYIQYNADQGHKEWVEAVCNSIRKATKIECLTDSKPDFQADTKARDAKQVKSMFRGGWVQDYPLNMNFMTDLYRTGVAGNTGDYSNKKFDALTKEADSADTVDEVVKAYQKAEKVLVEDMPGIPLWDYKANTGHSEKVDNVKIDDEGNPIYTGITVTK